MSALCPRLELASARQVGRVTCRRANEVEAATAMWWAPWERNLINRIN